MLRKSQVDGPQIAQISPIQNDQTCVHRRHLRIRCLWLYPAATPIACDDSANQTHACLTSSLDSVIPAKAGIQKSTEHDCPLPASPPRDDAGSHSPFSPWPGRLFCYNTLQLASGLDRPYVAKQNAKKRGNADGPTADIRRAKNWTGRPTSHQRPLTKWE